MESYINKFKELIKEFNKELKDHKLIAPIINCDKEIINLLDDLLNLVNPLENIIEKYDIKINYLNILQSYLLQIIKLLPLRGHNINNLTHQNQSWNDSTRKQFESNLSKLKNQNDQLLFNLDFFNKINFFSSNIVAIGANGSGKTTLSNKFKSLLQNNGVVIPAQRILLIPDINTILNPSITANNLKQNQQCDKTNKSTRDFGYLQQEFEFIINNLLAENTAYGNKYRLEALELSQEGKPIIKPNSTKLDKTFEIWNTLIKHRKVFCKDAMSIVVKTDNENYYPAIQMSDGEKVLLFLIGQILQSPENGFIVIDEPEMYLHKTLLKKLWDILEKERDDCLFIYLTHDLDFATSRTTAKKVWIKSYIPPDKWEIEEIPDNDIPEALLYELLGSNKNILFCEGIRGSLDERIYSLLFPNFTIIPVESGFNVINHTKAFNNINNKGIEAYGLIDSDHHPRKRIEKIKNENIFTFKVSEIENLLLDEKFLEYLAEKIMCEKEKIPSIKDEVINELKKLEEIQISNFITAKIDYYFKDSHISKGNSLSDLKDNYEDFTQNIDIDKWFNDRKIEIDGIISKKDYKSAISVFNNKGLKNIVHKNFNISDFIERAIKLLQLDSKSHESLYPYFPQELIEKGILKNVLSKEAIITQVIFH